MTAVDVHNAKAVRRDTGWSRWLAACPCGWVQDAGDRLAADRLANEHNEVAAVAKSLPCTCWQPRYDGEFDAALTPCARCRLEAVLERAS